MSSTAAPSTDSPTSRSRRTDSATTSSPGRGRGCAGQHPSRHPAAGDVRRVDPTLRPKAGAILLDGEEPARFDWAIRGGTFWSFHDPRTSPCREIVDVDQVEAIETSYLAFHEDIDEQNNFAHLLKSALRHQFRKDLGWQKKHGLLYFRAHEANQPRRFAYESSKKKTEAEVVNVSRDRKDPARVGFVRHHAFAPRFELLQDQWYLVVSPSYHFTVNGFNSHSFPDALLSGKKRLDNSASLRGQVIMWHRFLSRTETGRRSLCPGRPDGTASQVRRAPAGRPRQARSRGCWGSQKQKVDEADADQERLDLR